MDYFKYKGNTLYGENVSIEKLAARYGTPLYVYSKRAFLERFTELKKAFRKLDPLICYSVKACSNSAILRMLVARGAGLDIVSGGELFRAKKAGVRMNKVVYAGVGKTTEEITEAIKSGIYFFNVESEPELRRINAIAGRMGKQVNVALRLNPDIESHTHHYITTAKKENKFGIVFDTAREIFRHADRYAAVRIRGIHLHIGSQLTKIAPFVKALNKTLAFLAEEGVADSIDTINLGGGVGIVYDNEKTINVREYARALEKILVPRGLKLILEPGRYIAGNSAVFVTTVQYIKKTRHKDFAIVDGAMNDLIRPALYQAHHTIVPVVRRKKQKHGIYDVVGPVCESGDFFAKARRLPELSEGDRVALLGAGAYGFAMSSNYNSRPRPAEILIAGTRHYCIKKRETMRDIMQGEVLPTHL